MFFSKISKLSKNKTILIAPLDWGLGHATRCIPVIRQLLSQGFQVIIAADGKVQKLLQHEFPGLTIIHLSGYKILYSRNQYWLPLKIILQVPSILIRIYKEHQWLKKIIKQYSISAVISDNRFGLYHSSVPSVYITHQLLIKSGNSFTEKIIQKIQYWFIKKYTQCWVPDFEGPVNIAGELSHPAIVPPNVRYIGAVSRFEKKPGIEKLYDLMVIISGPEPQRSIFEKLLFEQLRHYKGNVLLVRGLPEIVQTDMKNNSLYCNQNKNIVIKNHLDAAALNIAMQQSELVICRSGYTTIMDLLKLQQKAILVPTPGQTEQEYLAKYLLQQNIFYAVLQQSFLLHDAVENANNLSSSIPFLNMENYKTCINQFAQSL